MERKGAISTETKEINNIKFTVINNPKEVVEKILELLKKGDSLHYIKGLSVDETKKKLNLKELEIVNANYFNGRGFHKEEVQIVDYNFAQLIKKYDRNSKEMEEIKKLMFETSSYMLVNQAFNCLRLYKTKYTLTELIEFGSVGFQKAYDKFLTNSSKKAHFPTYVNIFYRKYMQEALDKERLGSVENLTDFYALKFFSRIINTLFLEGNTTPRIQEIIVKGYQLRKTGISENQIKKLMTRYLDFAVKEQA